MPVAAQDRSDDSPCHKKQVQAIQVEKITLQFTLSSKGYKQSKS